MASLLWHLPVLQACSGNMATCFLRDVCGPIKVLCSICEALHSLYQNVGNFDTIEEAFSYIFAVAILDVILQGVPG